jgi:hypothetical protein
MGNRCSQTERREKFKDDDDGRRMDKVNGAAGRCWRTETQTIHFSTSFRSEVL